MNEYATSEAKRSWIVVVVVNSAAVAVALKSVGVIYVNDVFLIGVAAELYTCALAISVSVKRSTK